MVKGPARGLSSSVEAEYWEGFRQGDERAFSMLYKTYYPDLYRYGLKITRDEQATEDYIQDFFYKLWKSRRGLSAVNSVKAYLFKSFRRVVLDHQKGRKRREQIDAAAADADIMFSSEDILIGEQTSLERVRNLQKALNALTNRQREIIYLRFYDNLSYDQIEEVLSINNQTIRNSVSESIKALRKNLIIIFSLSLLLAVLWQILVI
jgi:RNA polymerase sigma factor (sigma-70 family)